MTHFRYVKVCNNLVTDEIDDQRIQSDYKCTIGLQNPEGKNSTFGLASAWWNRATRRPTPMTTWPPRPRAPSTQRTWTSTHEVNARVIPCAHSPVVRFWSSWSAHHIVSQVVRISHVIHACSERYSSTLSSKFHPTFSFSHSLSISYISSCTSSTTLRVVLTLRTSPKRRWTLLTNPTSPSLWAQELRLHGDLCRVPHKVRDSATILRATVLRGCGLRWHRARGDAFMTRTEYTSITPSEKACLSVSRRRPCGENRETCCGKWSGAKRWKRTD